MTHDYKDLARMLRVDASRYAHTYADRDDAEYQSMIDGDVADLRRVAAVIEKGDLKRAYRLAAKLDTAVRDGISDPVWRALTGGAALGHTEHDG